MTFDWFRRRFVKDEKPEEPETSGPPPSVAVPDETPAPTTEAVDYLAFAKAAYQKIKEREDSTTTDSQAAEVQSTPTVEATNHLETAALPDEGQISSTLAESEESPPELTQAAPTKAFFELDSDVTQRLEVLEVAESDAADSLDLSFDEGFRWSAEILAAQGRKPEDISVEEITWLQKLRQGLGKTRLNLINQLKSLVGRGPIDQDAVDEIEAVLLQSDVGVYATDRMIEALQARMRKDVLPPEEAVKYLKAQMRDMLTVGSPYFAPERDKLNIWLIVGVNGAGKTTTIGKISHIACQSDYRCLIAAGDTFRAAAVEQLQIWGQRAGVEVIANSAQNTDPAAIVFDAIAAAQARNTELLLIDTAGRLQNKKNLMDELAKIRRIIDKKAPDAIVESLLVLDSTLGQNGLRQAELFAEVAKLSGVVLTKLDSTAKGGIAFAITQQMELPIRFIGAGEGIEDLRPFSSYEFVEALISEY